MRLFVHGLICTFLMLRTGSIVYSSVKLIKIKELFLASLTQGKLSWNSQFHGSMASENEIKGN